MTETEWYSSHNLHQMLLQIQNKTSDRKMRLFAVCCCKLVQHSIPEIFAIQAIEATNAAEQFADKENRAGQRNMGRASASMRRCLEPQDRPTEVTYALEAARWSANVNALEAATRASMFAAMSEARATRRGRNQVDEMLSLYLHDIFGNPFRPLRTDPNWLTSTVVAIARGVYDERAFNRLPLLADALQDAGCENTDILDHCRGPGPHVRGCWVIDQLLGKS